MTRGVMIGSSQPEDVASTMPQVERAARPLDAEAMRRRIGARLFGDAEEPSHLDRFRVLRTLGVGGMGIVYAAQDDTLGRVVALKVIRDDVFDRREERERILREARALASLSDPNVVQLHEVVATRDAVFLVMEYVAGVTLSQWVRDEPRDIDAIVAVFAAAGRGLAAAHRADIVHRDIKPSNLLIGDDGRVRLVDFGLARPVALVPRSDAGTAVVPATPRSHDDPGATHSGTLAGTPAYMAPEVLLGGRADARGDQFSFCVALYESVYGRRPFADDASAGLQLLHHSLALPATAGGRRIPRFLRRLLARGLALRPDDRFSSLAELVAALESGPVRSRRWLSALGAAALAGGLVLAARMVEVPGPALCPAATAQLAGVWDLEARVAVRRAIPMGQVAADVEAGLDRYASEWLVAHRDACAATRIRGEQSEALLDSSMACLARRRSALAALTEHLRRPDVSLISAAPKLVRGLPAIDACRDAEALARGWARGGDDPRLDAAETMLVRAAAFDRDRESDQALALVDQALTAIQAVGDRFLAAEALFMRGRILAQELGDVAGGLRDLKSASDHASASGHDALSWKIWKERADIAVRMQHDAGAARELLAHARAAAERRSPRAPVDEAELLDTEGLILWLEARPEDALARRREALALRERYLAQDDPELAWSRLRVANATADVGQVEQAVEQLARLRQDVHQRLGVEHPAALLVELAEAQLLAGSERGVEARARIEHVRPLLRRVYGPQTRYLAIADLELAGLDAAAGRLPAAIAGARDVLQRVEVALPLHHDLRVEALSLLSDLYIQTDQPGAAIDVHQGLLALHDQRAHEFEDDTLKALLYNLAEGLCALDRCGEGLDYFTRLLPLFTGTSPDEAARMAFVHYGLAYGYIETGHPELALVSVERAYGLLSADPAADPHLAVENTRLLARCLQELRRDPRRVRALRAEADARARDLGIP